MYDRNCVRACGIDARECLGSRDDTGHLNSLTTPSVM